MKGADPGTLFCSRPRCTKRSVTIAMLCILLRRGYILQVCIIVEPSPSHASLTFALNGAALRSESCLETMQMQMPRNTSVCLKGLPTHAGKLITRQQFADTSCLETSSLKNLGHVISNEPAGLCVKAYESLGTVCPMHERSRSWKSLLHLACFVGRGV